MAMQPSVAREKAMVMAVVQPKARGVPADPLKVKADRGCAKGVPVLPHLLRAASKWSSR